jgi:hypothetical protein
MSSNYSGRFANHLRSGHHLPRVEATDSPGVAAQQNAISDGPVKLWEVTNLSASEFADEAARFVDLPRVALPDLRANRWPNIFRGAFFGRRRSFRFSRRWRPDRLSHDGAVIGYPTRRLEAGMKHEAGTDQRHGAARACR